MLNIYSRRSFLEKCALSGATMGLAALANTPLFLRRALAEGTIGQGSPKKKLFFVFLRGAKDALNSCIPIPDDSYSEQRSQIYIPRVGQTSPTDNTTGLSDYTTAGAYNSMPGTYGGNKMFDATVYNDLVGTNRLPTDITYSFVNAIPGGNGFAGFHPSMKFLAPVFNDGDLAIIHRVAYPRQSRSHFDSQIYWETGKPGDNTFKNGIFYRTMEEAVFNDPSGVGLQPLTGVSFQNSLPLLLRGSNVPMTNLSDPNRFSLHSIPSAAVGIGDNTANETSWAKMNTNSVLMAAKNYLSPAKGENRAILELQYESLSNTLKTFADIDFTDAGANVYVDSIATDGDTTAGAYNLFPVTNGSNGGYTAHGSNANKYVIPTNQYGFMRNVKAAALVLGKTDALVAGTEIGGWDTHNSQVSNANNPNPAAPATTARHTGQHANLVRTISWTIYALRRFFSNPTWSPNCSWNDVVVVFMTEFGRTSAQNNTLGTDHAEANVMLVAGGNVNGRIYCASTDAAADTFNGQNCTWSPGTGGQNGSMFQVAARYLSRRVDYRSVLGEIIRDHLGANDSSASAQLGRIIPGYSTSERNSLKTGGASPVDGTVIGGELGII
jgi:uncharacterized protein (DUF1501 family)